MNKISVITACAVLAIFTFSGCTQESGKQEGKPIDSSPTTTQPASPSPGYR